MTADHDEIVRLGLHKLRYGDFVLLEDCDTSFGRGYLGARAPSGSSSTAIVSRWATARA